MHCPNHLSQPRPPSVFPKHWDPKMWPRATTNSQWERESLSPIAPLRHPKWKVMGKPSNFQQLCPFDGWLVNVLRQSLALEPRLTWNCQSSCQWHSRARCNPKYRNHQLAWLLYNGPQVILRCLWMLCFICYGLNLVQCLISNKMSHRFVDSLIPWYMKVALSWHGTKASASRTKVACSV